MVTRSIVDAGLFVAMKNLIILIVAEKLKNINLWLDITIENDLLITSTNKSNDQNKYTGNGVQRVLIIG